MEQLLKNNKFAVFVLAYALASLIASLGATVRTVNKMLQLMAVRKYLEMRDRPEFSEEINNFSVHVYDTKEKRTLQEDEYIVIYNKDKQTVKIEVKDSDPNDEGRYDITVIQS